MSQYSETVGSFTRTGNYPLEANYIFNSEDELKQFYSDPIRKTTLHEGLLKVVSNENGQALYWVVNGNNGLEFRKVDASQLVLPSGYSASTESADPVQNDPINVAISKLHKRIQDLEEALTIRNA